MLIKLHFIILSLNGFCAVWFGAFFAVLALTPRWLLSRGESRCRGLVLDSDRGHHKLAELFQLWEALQFSSYWLLTNTTYSEGVFLFSILPKRKLRLSLLVKVWDTQKNHYGRFQCTQPNEKMCRKFKPNSVERVEAPQLLRKGGIEYENVYSTEMGWLGGTLIPGKSLSAGTQQEFP